MAENVPALGYAVYHVMPLSAETRAAAAPAKLGARSDGETSMMENEFFRASFNRQSGEMNSLALKSDGTVWAWGTNGYGMLGDGSIIDRLLPVQVKDTAGTGYLSGIVAIAAGDDQSLALKSDGTVWAWGQNTYGQLGDGTTINMLTPVRVVGINSVASVSAGNSFSVALKYDGTVWTWGLNDQGQLGTGNTTNN
jgi:alpha-tubulin suppressor-like RCC1 family protein